MLPYLPPAVIFARQDRRMTLGDAQSIQSSAEPSKFSSIALSAHFLTVLTRGPRMCTSSGFSSMNFCMKLTH